MNLSKRLNTLAHLVDPNFSNQIWDLCCDHGKLAFFLQELYPESKVFAVDIVDTGYLFEATDIIFKKLDATKVKDIAAYSTVIIAGVGSDTAKSILENLLKFNNCENLRFILSVHSKELEFREFLSTLKLKLHNECIVFEQKHFYDILDVSLFGYAEIPIFNQLCADPTYYARLIKYYSSKREHDYSKLLDLLSKKITGL